MLGEKEPTTRRKLRLLIVFLSVSMASSNNLQIHLVPQTPRVNQTVLFNVTGISENILFSEWYIGNVTSAGNQIIRYNNGNNVKNEGPQINASFDIFANGSFEIKSVTMKFQSNYTVSIQGSTTLYQKTVFLEVYDSNPDDPNSGLSGGAIAGIVISVIIGATATIVVVAVVYASKSKSKSKSEDSG